MRPHTDKLVFALVFIFGVVPLAYASGGCGASNTNCATPDDCQSIAGQTCMKNDSVQGWVLYDASFGGQCAGTCRAPGAGEIQGDFACLNLSQGAACSKAGFSGLGTCNASGICVSPACTGISTNGACNAPSGVAGTCDSEGICQPTPATITAAQQTYNACMADPTTTVAQCNAAYANAGGTGTPATAPNTGGGTPGSFTQQINGGGSNTGTINGGGNNTNSGSIVTLINPLQGGGNLQSFLINILNFVIEIGSIIVVLMLVFVGYKFVTAQGEPNKITEARTMLLWTILGALILLGSKAIAIGIQATVQALGS